MTRMWARHRAWLLGVGLFSLAGCVERTARIETRPEGALVFVNDEEVGVTPVKFSFVFYGDYDIVIRKPGYKTLKTNYRIDPPWYEYPLLDIVAEVLVPTVIRDEHVLPVMTLEPADSPPVADVVSRAVEARDRALFQGE